MLSMQEAIDTMREIKCICQIPSTLGEGPLWVADESALYWLDIVQKKAHRYNTQSQETKTWELSFELTSLFKRANGGFIGTVRDGFAFIDLDENTFEPIAMPESDIPGNRFNDGKLDAHGNFWSGSMDEAEKLASGVLYKLDRSLRLTKMDAKYIITNGPAFSPDGRTMYHNDTIKRVIYAFDVNEGEIGNKRVFHQYGDVSEGYPDGMTVDSEGNIYQCSFAGSRITKFSPSGEILKIINIPVPNITSCTFGGNDLDTLYITTARYLMSEEDINKYPLAGSLFEYKPGSKGLPTPVFLG